MKPKPVFLFIPLALASLALSASTRQQPLSSGWKQTERTDAVRGKYARFTLVGKFLKSPPGDNASNRPAMVVDCSAYNRSHKFKFWRGT